MSAITELLEQRADILAQNVAGWESSALQRIGRRIGRIGRMTEADAKTLNNIAIVNQDMDAIMSELAEVTGYNMQQIQTMYGDSIAEAHKGNKFLYDYRGKDFIPFSENKSLQALVSAYSKTTGGTMLNLTASAALNLGTLDTNGNFVPLKKFYTDTLDKAVMQISTGSTSFHSAMRQTIAAMGGGGIRVNYGGGQTRRLDTVVRQALLWGAKQASNEYYEMVGDEIGCDGIEIDWHDCPRPSHEFMQGKQYVLGDSRTINGVKFESADEALARLQDYGCLHFKTPIICGVSEPTYSKAELAKLNERNSEKYEINGKEYTRYEAVQMMRRLESGVRNEKTTRDVARSAGYDDIAKKSTARIKAYKAKYEEISNITGIPMDERRMSVTMAKNTGNVLQNGGNSGIISTKISNVNVVNPMDPSKYRKMKAGLNKNGIKTIEAKGDDLKYLQSLGAEASYGHRFIMHIGEIPSASAMFEEVIHSTQAKKYGEFVSSDYLELYSREIAANRMLLKYKSAYGFDDIDTEDITTNLQRWEEMYIKLMGYSYDEGSCFREI